MINLQDKKRTAYSKEELDKLEAVLGEYASKSVQLETETVVDLEKHLWLANGAAATAAIGFIQAKGAVSVWQYLGAWAFVFGILALVVLKYGSSANASRDRYRFQDAKSRFDANEDSDQIFKSVRDKTFLVLKRAYLFLQWGSGVAFMAGAVLTLIGVQCTA
ncbi:hypothetical protein [Thiohalomonas denitrificans]|uniref:Uncharacterized protein n=1 Tax=Thiohalomonas denitrificans TaxID=415747 RepID=A0A1G5R0U6_9GAMM|nr:hypothetical protein [Thiohalomonas denitrificans]SCZ67566.1 hypothetical protein SAMN03097708_03164 [Thiohalomonas denitrificans]